MKRSGAGGDDSMSKRQRGEPSANLANALSGLGLPSTSTLTEVERLYDEERSRESTLQRSITEGQREMGGGQTANQEVELSSRLEQYREELGALQTRRLLFDAAKKELEKSSGGGRKAVPAPKKRGGGKAGGGRKAVVGDEEGGEGGETSSSGDSGASSSSSSSSSSEDTEESSEGEEVAHEEDTGPFGRRRKKPVARRRAAPAAAARRADPGSDTEEEEEEGSDSGMRGGRRLRKSTAQRRKAAAGSGSEGEEEGLGEYSRDVKYAGANKKNQAKARARDRRLYGSDSEYSEDGGRGRGGKGGKGGGGGGGGGKRGGANFRDDYYEDEEGDEFDDEDGGADALASLEILNGILGGDDGGGGGGSGAPGGGSGSGSGSGAAANLALKALLHSSTPDTSPATLQDINSIRLSRQQALSYMGAPYFHKLAEGCYVKLAKLPPFPPEADVAAGRATKYRVCRIHAVGNGQKVYDPFKTDGGYDKAMLTRPHMDKTQIPRRTNMAFHLALGSSLTVPTEAVDSGSGKKFVEDRPRLCEIHALSDRQITELEWAEYLQRCSRNAAEKAREGEGERERERDRDKPSKTHTRDDAPTKADIRRKRKSAAALIHKSKFREEDVERTLLRKEAQIIDQVRTMPNVMYLKAKYETEKAVAEEEEAALPKDATTKVREAMAKKIKSFGRIIEAVEKETERRKLASQAAQREKALELGPGGGVGMGLGGDHSAAAAATAAAAASARGGGGKGVGGGGGGAKSAAAPGLSSLSTAVNAKFRERNAQRLRAAADDDRAPEPLSKDDEDELLGYVRQRSRPQSLFNVNAGGGYKKPSEEAEKKAEASNYQAFDITRLMEDAVPEVNPMSGASAGGSGGGEGGGYAIKGGAGSKKGGKQHQEEEEEEEEAAAVGGGGGGEEEEELDLFSDAPPKAPASEAPKKAAGMSFAEFKARKAGAKA